VEASAGGATGSSLVQLLSAAAAGLAAAARLDGDTAEGRRCARARQRPTAAGEPSLRLKRSQLEGRNPAIGSIDPGTLQPVLLAADSAQVRAHGDLTLRDLAAEGEAIRLRVGGRLALDRVRQRCRFFCCSSGTI
jgi:hypothetical protein